jgi:hypothetical protein
MPVPDLRLLGYAPTRPMLRVLRLPDAVAEPAPVSLDTGYALDDCLRRDGWLVFAPNINVWGLPLPFGERPFRVATETWVVATGADPRTVWLHGRDSPTVAEYDGVAREVRREIELPGARFSVAAVTPSGFLIHDDHSGLYAWEPSQPPRLLLDDIGGGVCDEGHTRMVCRRLSTDELIILDLNNGSHVTVARPEGCRWAVRVGVFSPDGALLAVDLDYSPEIAQEEALARIRQVALGQGKYELQPHRLGIIRCADGALTIADGVYDNYASIVWSLDSGWIVFATPFAPRGLWLTRPDEPKLEWISFGRRHAPSLLCDASDLIS